MKRFLIKIEGGDRKVIIEAVAFSDGTIVVNGGIFQACILSEEEIARIFPNAIIQRLD